MRIFNSKRKISIETKRIKNYLFYAVGEIVLVVIGIVIGLQVNKWNDSNIKQSKIEKYYTRINEEVDFSLKLIEYNTQYSDSLVKGLTLCLQRMEAKKADSVFIKNLRFLSDNEHQTFFFPVIDEFLELGFLSSVDDLELREQFKMLQYYRKQSNIDDINVQTFSEKLLKPQILEKMNFLDIDHLNYQTDYFDKLIFENDFENNYQELVKDLALWNLIIYRIDIEKNRLTNNKSLIIILKKLKEQTAPFVKKK